MADGMGAGDWPAWIALAATAVSALWQLRTNHLAKQDRVCLVRKVRIEALSKDLDEINAITLSYWTKAGSESYIEGYTLTARIKDVSSRTWEYKEFLWPDAPLDFNKIKTLITGGNFQVQSRPALKYNDPKIRDIGDLISGFKTKLRSASDKLDGL